MLAVQMGSTGTPWPAGPGFSEQAEGLRPLVRAVAAHILRQSRMHPDVDDCVSETLRRALEGRDRLREGEPLRPWLLGIARHVALDAVRARQRSARRLAEPAGDDPDESPLDRVADSGPGADERLDLARRGARVRAAMAKLPPDHRRALEMFHVEGLPYRDISAELGVPIGTVCTWISRGRRAIAVALEAETDEVFS